jgi:hypothetical protein
MPWGSDSNAIAHGAFSDVMRANLNDAFVRGKRKNERRNKMR